MADTFAQALLQKAEAPHRGGTRSHEAARGLRGPARESQSALHDYDEREAEERRRRGGENSTQGPAEAVPAGSAIAAEDAQRTEAVGTNTETNTDGSTATNGSSPSNGSTTDSGDVASNDSNPLTTSESIPTTDSVDVADARSRSGFSRHADLASFAEGTELRRREAVVEGFARAVESLDEVTHAMLAYYRATGRATAEEAHLASGGSGDRRYAYSRNKTLRRAGVIEHRSCGEYAYALPALVRRVYGDNVDRQELAEVVAEIEVRAGLVEPE